MTIPPAAPCPAKAVPIRGRLEEAAGLCKIFPCPTSLWVVIAILLTHLNTFAASVAMERNASSPDLLPGVVAGLR